MAENFRKVKDYIIHRKEISNLYFNMGEGISTHDLSMWIKSKTDDEWVVVPKFFCAEVINFLEREFEREGLTKAVGKNLYLEQIKRSL